MPNNTAKNLPANWEYVDLRKEKKEKETTTYSYLISGQPECRFRFDVPIEICTIKARDPKVSGLTNKYNKILKLLIVRKCAS